MKTEFRAMQKVTFGLGALLAVSSISVIRAEDVASGHEPLSVTFDIYAAAAKRGDLAAASTLFREAKECLLTRRFDARMSAMKNDKNSVLNAPDKQGGINVDEIMDKIKRAEKRAEASRSMCAGTEGKITNESIYDVALTAAKLGDVAAAACFIAAPWPIDVGKFDTRKAGEYQKEAEAIEAHAVEKGDWRLVRAMELASADGPYRSLSPYTRKPDALSQLRYEKLLRLGASPGSDEASNLDLSIQILSERLAAADVAKADEWARRMFAEYYATFPPSPHLTACDA